MNDLRRHFTPFAAEIPLLVKSIDERCECTDEGGDRVGGIVVDDDDDDVVRVVLAPLLCCLRPFDSERDVPHTCLGGLMGWWI